MKKLILLGVLVLFLSPIQFVQAKNRLTKLDENVYAYVNAEDFSPATSYGSNVGVVIGENGVLVIDTLTSSKDAKKLINDIKEITNKPIKWVIDTHYHFDHALGNSAFEELGAQIISSEKTAANLKETMQYGIDNISNFGITEEQIEGTKVSYPVITFKEKMAVDTGGIKVEIYQPGPSHTNGNSFVYLPDQKIIFTGDILFTGVYPYLGEGNIKEWSKILDYIATFNANQIIPGHGPVSTNKDLKDMKTFINLFDKNAKKLVKKAKNKQDTAKIAEELVQILPQRNGLNCLIEMNLKEKYIPKN